MTAPQRTEPAKVANVAMPYINVSATGDLLHDFLNAAAVPMSCAVELGTGWTSACLNFLSETSTTSSPEERLKAQEQWVRSCTNLCAEYVKQVNNAAISSAKQTALDVARVMDVEVPVPIVMVE